jgi:hypothetical protein
VIVGDEVGAYTNGVSANRALIGNGREPLGDAQTRMPQHEVSDLVLKVEDVELTLGASPHTQHPSFKPMVA